MKGPPLPHPPTPLPSGAASPQSLPVYRSSEGMMKGIEDILRALNMSATRGSAAAKAKETNTSWSRRPRTGSRRPSHVLLNVEAVVGVHRNRTTAVSSTRNGEPIEVSFLLKRPPQPSRVYVASDDLNPSVGPVVVILCSTDDLLLLRVNVGRTDAHLHLKHHHDYFVYRSCTEYPTLEYPTLDYLKSPPSPVFQTEEVGLLPRRGYGYTVAALVSIGRDDVYQLHLYHSDTRAWTTRRVSVVEPPQWDPLPKRIPLHCGTLLRHYTSSAVTIGGEGGTMAWVDAWRSILLCDVLRPDPSLRGVPVPLPSRQMSLNGGSGVQLDFPGHSRGVSFNRDKGCLVLVHLERYESPTPLQSAWRGLYGEEIRVLDWEVTTWSNTKMSDSLEDWHQERSVRASNFTIDARMLEGSGLLCRPPPPPPPPRDHSNNEAATATAQQQQLELHNLSVCQPTLSPNGKDDIVYVVAREKYLHPKAWFLAVDMNRQGTLKHVAYIGDQPHPFCHGIYCLSRISKYTNPKMRLLESSATVDPVSVDEEETNCQGGAVDLSKADIRIVSFAACY